MKTGTPRIDITSPQNPKIKWLRSLHKSSVRRDEGLILVEGAKEISFAISGGLHLSILFVAPEIYQNSNPLPKADDILTISQTCFERVAYRSDSDGLIGIFKTPKHSLHDLQLSKNPLILILESVEKPGNLGAVIRTADAAGCDAVLVCDERTDLWNPNTIRASVGTIFSKQVVTAPSQEIYNYLQAQGITIYAAELTEQAIPYTAADYTSPTALLFGTEHEGVSHFWLEHAQHVILPMHGRNDSLNVSVTAGILTYEALRQRNSHDH